MGRSSGGGSRSSGGFSGSRSSGGGSFGGRSSSNGNSFSYNSRGPSYNHRPHYSRIYAPFVPRRKTVIINNGRNSKNSSNFWIVIFTIIIALLLLSLVLASFDSRKNSSDTKVIENTTKRTALKGVVNKTGWYQDELGWVSNSNTLIKGLESFYNKTGVQPYVLFIPYDEAYWNGNVMNSSAADEYLEKFYNDTFTDEGHFLFAYFEAPSDSKQEMEGEFRYLNGYSVNTIMDEEALKIFWGYLETNYYNVSLSMEKMFASTFESTAKTIMSKPTNGWDTLKFLGILGAIIIVFIVIYKIIKANHKRKKEKEEYVKNILEKPLESFGVDTKDLEKKYEENS